MRIDANKVALNSYMGSFLSFILFCLVVIFTYLKADVLIQKKDVDVLSTVNDRHFTPEDKINYKKDSFYIAAAFTAFDSETEYILDPSYGELVFMHYYWGIQEDG